MARKTTETVEIWTTGPLLSSLLEVCSSSSTDVCGVLRGSGKCIMLIRLLRFSYKESTVRKVEDTETTDEDELLHKVVQITSISSFEVSSIARIHPASITESRGDGEVVGFFQSRRYSTCPSLRELSTLKVCSEVGMSPLLLHVAPQDSPDSITAEALKWSYNCYCLIENAIKEQTLQIRSFHSDSEADYKSWSRSFSQGKLLSGTVAARSTESAISELINDINTLQKLCEEERAVEASLKRSIGS